MVSRCPPEDDLLAFSSGDVSDAARVTLLGHLAECDECRMVTSELSKARLGQAATATPEPHAPSSRPPPSGHAPLVPYERPPFLAFSLGETIAGKFKVVKVLGAGGMGVVIEAEHLLLQRRVALKFMGPALVSDPEAKARFFREARAASLIPNEHVVKILDVDMLEDGTPYIVMERLHGHDLATMIEREGRVEASLAVGYVLEAMEALAHAHAKGIVHRDLKPANLFLAKREDGGALVKVLDFGIAKSQDSGASAGVTTSRTVLGSPRYMAPEQMQSAKAADMRADVWALGTILFELVSGRPAFEGETLGALTVAICAGPPPSLSSVFPGVPALLDQTVSACLTRPIDARLPNVGALARALAPLAPASAYASIERISTLFPDTSGGAGSLPPARAESVPPSSLDDAFSSSAAEPKKAPSLPRHFTLVAISALGLGALATLGFLAAHRATPASTEVGATVQPLPSPKTSSVPSNEPALPSLGPSSLSAVPSSPGPASGHPVVASPSAKKAGGTPPLPTTVLSTLPGPPSLPPPVTSSPYDERK